MLAHSAGFGPPGWKQTSASTALSALARKTLTVPPKQ